MGRDEVVEMLALLRRVADALESLAALKAKELDRG